jgi:hypothetical protein
MDTRNLMYILIVLAIGAIFFLFVQNYMPKEEAIETTSPIETLEQPQNAVQPQQR